MLILSTCSGSPASSFPGLRKAGRGLGTRQRIRLGSQVSRVTFLRGLDEVCQLVTL